MDRFSQVGSLQDKLGIERLDQLISSLGGLSACGPVATSVLELLTDGVGVSDGPAELSGELSSLVSLDPAMTAGVLSLANCSRGRDVVTVAQAIEKLGFEVVRAGLLAGRGYVVPACGRGDDTAFDNEAFNRHCLAVAIAAEKLSAFGETPLDPGQAFVCGLLHDLGKLVLVRAAPKSYDRVIRTALRRQGNISEYERDIIGVDHAVAGLHLARQWRLGNTIQAVTWLAHQPGEAIPGSIADRAMVEIVGLADTIARESDIGFSGNFKFARTSAQMAAQMGLAGDIPARIAEGLADDVRELLADLESGSPVQNAEAYHRAVARSNTELGKINDQLCSGSAQLQVDSEALGKLRRFASSISPEALLPETLGALAEAVADVVSVEPSAAAPIIAYCCGQDTEGVTLIIADRSDCPDIYVAPPNPAFDASAVDAGGGSSAEAMAAVLGDVGVLRQWIDPGIYAHHRLICRERWIGGVLSPADAPDQGRMDESLNVFGEILALTLAMSRGQSRATRLSEQLAGAGEVLAATQEALAEARTLAAMGEMAAGAGHELNNPLAVISGRAQLMRDKAASPEERKTWRQIADQAHRISDIITDLMDFASPRRAEPDVVDVDALTAEIEKAFAASEDPVICACEIIVQPPARPLNIIADIVQIRAALREVVTNAAIAGKGEGERKVRISSQAGEANDTVVIAISDNGPGMDAQTLSSVFTPFFSAQEAGRRVGMGLPRAQRYVINNDGRMWIETRLGEGTTVFIELPRADQ
ncbi:MAG: HDOD domain-containing protein [Phycisphaerae bacterium]|jgi:signal transduction histidine kinase/HD-like signal output (HDOD) protein|nr:HDOD domain-containing protein [Phycisphaerae bacterium]